MQLFSKSEKKVRFLINAFEFRGDKKFDSSILIPKITIMQQFTHLPVSLIFTYGTFLSGYAKRVAYHIFNSIFNNIFYIKFFHFLDMIKTQQFFNSLKIVCNILPHWFPLWEILMLVAQRNVGSNSRLYKETSQWRKTYSISTLINSIWPLY